MNTHYDNLQVSRNASLRVIRAAYKSLSQEWHPDKHPNDRANSERIMKIINQAYEVLSDPALRAAHDKWIDTQIHNQHDGAGRQNQQNDFYERYNKETSNRNATGHDQESKSSNTWTNASSQESAQANKNKDNEIKNEGVARRIKSIAIGTVLFIMGGKLMDSGNLFLEWVSLFMIMGGFGAVVAAFQTH
jgi:curved DNA-binding protein CbpA